MASDSPPYVAQKGEQRQEEFQLNLSLASAPQIDYFVGRETELLAISSNLMPSTRPERKVVVLYGLGGIGKSQIAIEFAKRCAQDFSAILWLNAKTEDSLKRSFAFNAGRLPKRHISQHLLFGPSSDTSLDSIMYETIAWLDLAGNHRWLLIYDNMDNPQIPENTRQGAYDARRFFPKS